MEKWIDWFKLINCVLLWWVLTFPGATFAWLRLACFSQNKGSSISWDIAVKRSRRPHTSYIHALYVGFTVINQSTGIKKCQEKYNRNLFINYRLHRKNLKDGVSCHWCTSKHHFSWHSHHVTMTQKDKLLEAVALFVKTYWQIKNTWRLCGRAVAGRKMHFHVISSKGQDVSQNHCSKNKNKRSNASS